MSDIIDRLTKNLQLAMASVFVRVLSNAGHKVKHDDILSFRTGDEVCEVICKQGSFVIDRKDEKIIAYTPNPDYQHSEEVIH